RGEREAFDLPAAGRPLGPAGDPGEEGLVLPGVAAEADAAVVGDPAGRLLQDQAVVRGRQVHPPAEVVPRERGKVPVRVEAEEGEAEPVAALERAVAGAGVAPGLA